MKRGVVGERANQPNKASDKIALVKQHATPVLTFLYDRFIVRWVYAGAMGYAPEVKRTLAMLSWQRRIFGCHCCELGIVSAGYGKSVSRLCLPQWMQEGHGIICGGDFG